MKEKSGDVAWHYNFDDKYFFLNIKNSCSNSCLFCTTRIICGSLDNINFEKKKIL